MQTIEERVSEIFKTDARTLEKPCGFGGLMMPYVYRRLLEKFFRDFESDLLLSFKNECREKHLTDTRRIIELEEEIAELKKQVSAKTKEAQATEKIEAGFRIAKVK